MRELQLLLRADPVGLQLGTRLLCVQRRRLQLKPDALELVAPRVSRRRAGSRRWLVITVGAPDDAPLGRL